VIDNHERTSENTKEEAGGTEGEPRSESNFKDLEAWLEMEPLEPVGCAPDGDMLDAGEIPSESRLGWIKQSYALLRQFTPKELKILKSLKRNTSPKAWTLREDLVVLTLNLSNREIAEILKDRNKEAVKKRLQLLRSKGLAKRPPEEAAPQP
jgi:hypothetical protein